LSLVRIFINFFKEGEDMKNISKLMMFTLVALTFVPVMGELGVSRAEHHPQPPLTPQDRVNQQQRQSYQQQQLCQQSMSMGNEARGVCCKYCKPGDPACARCVAK